MPDSSPHSRPNVEALRAFIIEHGSVTDPTRDMLPVLDGLIEQLEALRAAALPFAQPNDTTLAEYEALRAALYPASSSADSGGNAESRATTTRITATPVPDLVWRATISGLLAELTTEVRELAEVVIAMNEKLAALEAPNTDTRSL